MTWDMLTVIGTIAFSISGAVVAMEEDLDIFGVLFLGFITAFGGGAIRNILIGVPVSELWSQGLFFQVSFFSILLFVLFPNILMKHWHSWGAFFDAIGLASFAMQGALFAVEMGHPLSAVIVAAVLTGSGGGLIRDVLANRKPMVLHSEVYALWALVGGLFIGMGWVTGGFGLFLLFVLLVSGRVCSYRFQWKLPHRTIPSM
ncbi:trimeric intracellular cation channel family protein [Marinococcus luteus]|uniref:trimeric intracellular cation channel family protein n=1 Tax=Marinococcus luteus TaxID=1122204 RepID=UPI002ACCF563|nr:trimeric intracellular cation channel family protein [Marinococcus luteus]MDZ5782610.1 trimeric intracellular cation channel family protein [Marinococcus luteus]